jgi:hypothetical protein
MIVVCDIFNPCDLLPCNFNAIAFLNINFDVSNLVCFLVISNMHVRIIGNIELTNKLFIQIFMYFNKRQICVNT